MRQRSSSVLHGRSIDCPGHLADALGNTTTNGRELVAATKHPTVVTVVQAPACHYCEDAAAALAELSTRLDFLVRTLERDSDEGRGLILRHRPPMRSEERRCRERVWRVVQGETSKNEHAW